MELLSLMIHERKQWKIDGEGGPGEGEYEGEYCGGVGRYKAGENKESPWEEEEDLKGKSQHLEVVAGSREAAVVEGLMMIVLVDENTGSLLVGHLQPSPS